MADDEPNMSEANPPNANPTPGIRKLATSKIVLIVAAMVLSLLVVSAAIDWMPEAFGFSDDVDPLFFFIYWVSVFFTLLIAGTLVFFLMYYKQTDKAAAAPGTTTHSTALELTWTIIPVFIVLAIFAYGFRGYMDMAVAPTGAKEVVVLARQWSWSFQYPNGYWDNDLHVAAGTDVKLILQSDDVIHSLFIPQFRAKKDVVPGRFNTMWFPVRWDEQLAQDPEHGVRLGEGEEAPIVLAFDLYCTEYCGQSHSQMNRKVYIHRDQAAFDAWLANASIPWNNEEYAKPAKWGKRLWRNQCQTCHTIDGSAGTGPTWLNVFGSEREMADGSTVTADEQYIRESVTEPQKHIVAGFTGQNMPTFAGQLKDWDIFAITQFMKSLSDKGGEAEDNWDRFREEGVEGEAGDDAGGADGASSDDEAGDDTDDDDQADSDQADDND